jgi:hypothetical protein
MAESLRGLTFLMDQEVLDIAEKRMQGKFVGNFFIPNRPVEGITYLWHYYGLVGGMTPEVGENDIGPLIDTEYEQRTGTIKFYRERSQVSDYTSVIKMRNVTQDKIELLTDRLAMRIEQLKVGGIANNAIRTTDTLDITWHDCNLKGDHWAGGSGAVSIMDHIIDAQQSINEYAKDVTDTILCGTRATKAINKSVEVRDWDRRGPMSVELIQDGRVMNVGMPGNIGRLMGHEVFVSNASILSNPKNPRSPLIPLVDKDVYIFKRGQDLGRAHIFIPMQIQSERNNLAHKMEYQIEMAMKVNITRPQLIYTVKDAIKT